MSAENPLEKKIVPTWIRPNLETERGEIERVIREFLGQEPTEEKTSNIINILESASVIDLSYEDWRHLENTESFQYIRPGHVEDAEKVVEDKNEKLPPDNKRDFKAVLNGFNNGGKMECPTILRDKDGRLHLVSGNTRLMIARALGITPKVIIGEIK
jgi:hypothetical protein